MLLAIILGIVFVAFCVFAIIGLVKFSLRLLGIALSLILIIGIISYASTVTVYLSPVHTVIVYDSTLQTEFAIVTMNGSNASSEMSKDAFATIVGNAATSGADTILVRNVTCTYASKNCLLPYRYTNGDRVVKGSLSEWLWNLFRAWRADA